MGGLRREKQGYSNRKQNRNRWLEDNTPWRGPPWCRIHCMELKVPQGEALAVSLLEVVNPLHGVERALSMKTSMSKTMLPESIAWSWKVIYFKCKGHGPHIIWIHCMELKVYSRWQGYWSTVYPRIHCMELKVISDEFGSRSIAARLNPLHGVESRH